MTRDALDRYYTPQALADAVVTSLARDLGDISYGSCLEPHSGKGAFVRALRAHGAARVVTCDVDPEAVRGDFHHEQLFETVETVERFDLIVGNPPFGDAERQIEKALSLLTPTGTLAFLLPLQFWGSMGRAEWWKGRKPSSVKVVRPRPSFTGDGSDFREIALWTWYAEDLRINGGPSLGHLDWNKAAATVRRTRKACHQQLPIDPSTTSESAADAAQ